MPQPPARVGTTLGAWRRAVGVDGVRTGVDGLEHLQPRQTDGALPVHRVEEEGGSQHRGNEVRRAAHRRCRDLDVPEAAHVAIALAAVAVDSEDHRGARDRRSRARRTGPRAAGPHPLRGRPRPSLHLPATRAEGPTGRRPTASLPSVLAQWSEAGSIGAPRQAARRASRRAGSRPAAPCCRPGRRTGTPRRGRSRSG